MLVELRADKPLFRIPLRPFRFEESLRCVDRPKVRKRIARLAKVANVNELALYRKFDALKHHFGGAAT
jgi:hypothetical protein